MVNSNFFCPDRTKGYTIISLKIDNNIIDIINTHMPFGSSGTTKIKKFYESLEEWLSNNNFKSDDRIIFGDLNTGSLLTKDCYKKDIDLCDQNSNSNNNDLYCKLSNKLEQMSFNKTTSHFVSSNNKNITCKRQDCSFKKLPSNNVDLLDLLKKSDYIGNPPNNCEIFNNYKEQDIIFFPTYKRDTKNGLFKLSKDNYGRLPGYADRILYKSKNLLNLYIIHRLV